MPVQRTRISCFAIAASLIFSLSAFAHVRVSPRESKAGAIEHYSMFVPTERDSATVRLEIEFPAALTVNSLHEKPGWTIEQKKDSQGRIIGAVWSGGSIPAHESAEFYFEARNPAEDTKLEWKVIQFYENGTRSEWTGPQGTRTPASVTMVKKGSTLP